MPGFGDLARGQGIPIARRTVGPGSATRAHPPSMITRPGTRSSRERRRPVPTAMALGGVLMTNGTPSDVDTATMMAVDGAGSSVRASGTRNAAVAVLLITAESIALTRQRVNSRTNGGRSDRGTYAAPDRT